MVYSPTVVGVVQVQLPSPVPSFVFVVSLVLLQDGFQLYPIPDVGVVIPVGVRVNVSPLPTNPGIEKARVPLM